LKRRSRIRIIDLEDVVDEIDEWHGIPLVDDLRHQPKAANGLTQAAMA